MGCLSSTQQELRADADPNIEINNNNVYSNTNSNNSSHPSTYSQSSNPHQYAQQNSYQPHINNNRTIINQNAVTHSNNNPNTNYQVTNWTTNDVISYICSLENGKFCDEKYDIFKTGLQSLGIDGSTINTLCHDPNILKDIGLNDENDITIIQTAFVTLYSNQQNIIKQPSLAICKEDDESQDDDFFPLSWKFPTDDAEKIKNAHYVGQKLMITNKFLHPTPSKCIYIENNWIVIEYLIKENNENLNALNIPMSQLTELSLSNQSNSILPSPTNHANIHKNKEKLHVIKDQARIQKMSAFLKEQKVNNNNNNNGIQVDLKKALSDDNIFETEYYGMSCAYSSNSVVGIVIPDCYIDPITYEIMNNPVTSKTSGRTYDESMILQHLNEYGTDPFNQQEMRKEDLYQNKELKRAIDRWLINNPTSVTMQ